MALAIGNRIHFARPIMGDAKIIPLDFGLLASRTQEVLEIAEILIFWFWVWGISYNLVDPIMGEVRITSMDFGWQNLANPGNDRDSELCGSGYRKSYTLCQTHYGGSQNHIPWTLVCGLQSPGNL